MEKNNRSFVSLISSFWKIFRIIFVIYFLFLLKEVFHRWDGFSYYASFSEFIPAVALISVLWAILALLTTVTLWLPLRLFEWFSYLFEHEKRRYLLMFEKIFILNAVSVWIAKKLILPDKAALEVKVIVFFCVVTVSAFLTWLLFRKARKWVDRIQEKIVPDIGRFIQERIALLVWPFGVFVLLSIPLVAYHAWFKQTNNIASTEISQSSAPDDARPNIILITFDALTARDMSVYGYHKETTPFISEWAKDATIFTLLEAESNFTTPAVASLMTGKRVWTHQAYHLRGSGHIKNKTENLPFVLKQYGYYNAAFVVNYHASVRTLRISESFNFSPFAIELIEPGNILFGNLIQSPGFFDTLLYKMFGERIILFDWITDDRLLVWKQFRQDLTKTTMPPEKTFNSFLANYDDFSKPFFVWIHMFPPHDPYLPPEPYKGMFSDQGKVDKTYPYWYWVPMRNSYDEFIRYCDNQFKNFIISLEERQLENTIIVLSSDHGESFEHGYILHGGPYLYEQLTHIPLIIKEPGQTEGKIINGPVEQIDIPATILDLAKIQLPSWMEGRSLVTPMRGGKNPQRPVFSMNLEKSRSRGNLITKGTIAVWEGNYKLIHYLQKKESLLFNIKKDPGEIENLIDREPEVGHHLLGLIKTNLESANERIRLNK